VFGLEKGFHRVNFWRSAECGVRSGEWGVRSGECGVRNAEWGVGSVECGVGSVECGMRSAEWGVGSGEWGMGNGELGVRSWMSSEEWMREPNVRHPEQVILPEGNTVRDVTKRHPERNEER
jgi:hypothetical protein